MPDLGKYAIEVLAAYGATALILTVLVWASWARSKRLMRELAKAEERLKDG